VHDTCVMYVRVVNLCAGVCVCVCVCVCVIHFCVCGFVCVCVW